MAAAYLRITCWILFLGWTALAGFAIGEENNEQAAA